MAEFTGSRRECLAYIHYRVRQKLKSVGVVSAAKPTRSLQVFDFSGFSRESDVWAFIRKIWDSLREVVYLGDTPRPPCDSRKAYTDVPLRSFRMPLPTAAHPPLTPLHFTYPSLESPIQFKIAEEKRGIPEPVF